jgi:hypothetical protein
MHSRLEAIEHRRLRRLDAAAIDTLERLRPPAPAPVEAQNRAPGVTDETQYEGVARGAVAQDRPQSEQPEAGYVSTWTGC